MTVSATAPAPDLRWAQPSHYDPRDYATRPELAPVFIPPPPTWWQEWVEAEVGTDHPEA